MHTDIRAHSLGNHIALRVRARLLGRNGACTQKLAHQGMILRHLAHHAVTEKICAAVAHMADIHMLPAFPQHRQRSAHAAHLRLGQLLFIYNRIGLRNGFAQDFG